MIKSAATRALLIAALLSGSCAITVAQAKAPPVVPTMKLQGLDGKVYDLAELRGSVVLVSFGATWCAPCTTELHALEELLAEFRGKPVKFFWVSVERPEEINNAGLRQYAKERKLTFPVLRDTGKMVFFQFADRVRLPMVVLLNKDGKIEAPATFGMKSRPEDYKAEIRSRLNKLLTVTLTATEAARDQAAERTMTNAPAPAATLSQRMRQ
jgi:peroxiredoxin